MRDRLFVALIAFTLSACAGRTHHHGGAASDGKAMLFDDLGTHHHWVTTRSPEVQRYFDQGLRLMYAFNHDEATKSFQEATRLDPGCAMAWWGIALAAGPNYNDPGDRDRDRRAYGALEKALALRGQVSEKERAYIDALGHRYTKEPPPDRKALDAAYANAMREVARRYPDDVDALTLFAESLMDLRPWDLWTLDGKPQPGTEEIVTTLETALARDPNHPGANHYYIHAVEASANPGRAVGSADRLRGLVPGAGHLEHMPSHIYMRVGRYEDAVTVNERAVAADRRYIAAAKPTGMYPMMYYPHNIDFLWAAASMDGRSADTIRAAREIAAATTPEMARQMSDVEPGLVAPMFALARFGRWEDILKESAPPEDLPFARGAWHYARGLAFVRLGRGPEATAEVEALRKVIAATPPTRTVGQVNYAKTVLELADHVLAGEQAAKEGKTKDAVRHLRQAVTMQDRLRYMEPPPWYYPVRQSLGAVLLEAGQWREAEAVFRDDLKKNPENGWSLFGLGRALQGMRRDAQAAEVQERFQRAWARSDVQLESSRF